MDGSTLDLLEDAEDLMSIWEGNTPPRRWLCYISTADRGVFFFTEGRRPEVKKNTPRSEVDI